MRQKRCRLCAVPYRESLISRYVRQRTERGNWREDNCRNERGHPVHARPRCDEGYDEVHWILCAVGFVVDGGPWGDFGHPERLRATTTRNSGIAIECGDSAVAGYTCRRNCSRCARRRSTGPELNAYAGAGAIEPLRRFGGKFLGV